MENNAADLPSIKNVVAASNLYKVYFMATTIYTILQILLIILGILLTILVMCRKGEVGGLSGAFGGLGGDTAFGVKAQKQLDKIITWLAFIFLLIVIAMNTPMFRNASRNISVEAQQENSAPDKQ